MRIDDDHLYHGAALNQIAEDPHFTAINVLTTGGMKLRNSYRINDDIGVHLKYSTSPVGGAREYKFTFPAEHLADLRRIQAQVAKTFIALICVKDRQVCCLPLQLVDRLLPGPRGGAGRDR